MTRTRLQETVYAGDNKLKVPYSLDWQVGEKLGIAATNMRTMDYDECTILEYDSLLGEVTCESEFDGYHFGATDSTEGDFSVDMRAEIWLMDRNIKITASQDDIGFVLQEPWGCQVLVSDFREATLVQRIGNLYMDNV